MFARMLQFGLKCSHSGFKKPNNIHLEKSLTKATIETKIFCKRLRILDGISKIVTKSEQGKRMVLE